MGMAVTVVLNIREKTIRLNRIARPGNFFLARGKAHMEARMMCPAVPTAVMNSEL